MRSWPALLAAVALPAGSMLVGSNAFAVPVRPTEARPNPSPITDRFALRGSFFTSKPDTQIRLDSSGGTQGTQFTAEDDFGLDDDIQQGRIELIFRMGRSQRNKLRVDYFKMDRFAVATLNRTINFGDGPFNAGEGIASSIDYRAFGFTDTYSLFKAETFEVGFGLGIYALQAELRGEVVQPPRQRREEATGAGAFPTFAMDTTWLVTPRISISARGQYFSTTVGDFRGLMSDYHGDVQFRWRPNLAFGLGYTALKTSLDVQEADFPGRFAITVRGPEAFVRASF
jgi:hypothetical protein